jgi:DNA polymerase III alpha subunit
VKINNYGEVEISESEAFDALYSGKTLTLENVYIDTEGIVNQYNLARDLNADRIVELKKIIHNESDSIELFDKTNQSYWFMPKDYCPNLSDHLYSLCNTPDKKARVEEELLLFTQHGMYEVLVYCKYLVDTMRENNIVWGVGRGSSVASYILYLLGVHKIDSLKYELDIKEFLK